MYERLYRSLYRARPPWRARRGGVCFFYFLLGLSGVGFFFGGGGVVLGPAHPTDRIRADVTFPSARKAVGPFRWQFVRGDCRPGRVLRKVTGAQCSVSRQGGGLKEYDGKDRTVRHVGGCARGIRVGTRCT